MALLHWFQLNGDWKDYGTDYVSTWIRDLPSFDDDGKLGKSMRFSNQNFEFENPFIGLNEWTLAFWVRDNGSNAWSDIFTFQGSNFRLEFNGSGSTLFYADSGQTDIPIASGTTFSAFSQNVWHHVVLVFDDGNFRTYFDGVLKNNVTGRPKFSNSSSHIWFGDRAYAGNSSEISLNDIRCYDEGLSLNEVIELYKCKVLHYDFEQASNINFIPDPYFTSGNFPFSHSSPNGTVKVTKSGDELTFVGTDNTSNEIEIFYEDGDMFDHRLKKYAGRKFMLSIEYRVNEKLIKGSSNVWVGLELACSATAGGQWPHIWPDFDPYCEIGVWKTGKCYLKLDETTTAVQWIIGMRNVKGSVTFRHPKLELIDAPDLTVEQARASYSTSFVDGDLYKRYASNSSRNLLSTFNDCKDQHTANGIRYDYGGGYQGGPVAILNSSVTQAYWGHINLKPSTTYTMCGWVRSEGVFTFKRVYIKKADMGADTIDITLNFNSNTSSGWAYFYKSFTTDVTHGGKHRVLLEIAKSSDSSTYFYFSQLQITESSRNLAYADPLLPDIPDESGYGNSGYLSASYSPTAWGNICRNNDICPIGKQFAVLGTETNLNPPDSGVLYGVFKNPITSVKNFTINMWIKIYQNGYQNSGLICISSRRHNIGGDYASGGALNSYDGKTQANFTDSTSANIPASYTSFAGDGKWHMYTISRNGGTITTYKDGVQAGSVSCGANAVMCSFDHICIGRSTAGEAGRYCKMAIADLEVYLAEFSASEILSLYKAMANIDKKYRLSAHGFAERGNRIPTVVGTYPRLAYATPGSNGVFNLTSLKEESVLLDSNFTGFGGDKYASDATITNNGSSITLVGKVWYGNPVGKKIIDPTHIYNIECTLTTSGSGHVYLGIEQYGENGESLGSNDLCQYFYDSTENRINYSFTAKFYPSNENCKRFRLRILNDWGTNKKSTLTISHLKITDNETNGEKTHFTTYDDGRMYVDKISEL